MKNNRWKASVQGYEMDLLYYISKLYERLDANCYHPLPTFDFPLHERGKWRQISAHHIIDRTLYKSFTLNYFDLEIANRIVPNNSASQKGKGTDHAISMFKQGLRTAYNRWGTDFYVITADYHNYFGSIPHDMIPSVISLSDPRCAALLSQYVEIFPGDFGIGIGGEPSQLIAIVYPAVIDRDVLCNCPSIASGRYMDDMWAICRTREEARFTRDCYIEKSEKLGLELNMNRTAIHHMGSDSVIWLKKRTHIDPDTGKIIMQLDRKNVRERKRAIQFQYSQTETGNVPRAAAFQSIQCWCGYALKYNSYKQVQLVVDRFSELFDVPYNVSRHLLHKKNKGWLQMCEDYHLL